MKLYVMRHGPAEDQAESGRDFDRALTAPGRDRVRSVAKALLEAREEPHLVFTSPLVRAVQTAEIVAIATKLSDHAHHAHHAIESGTVETRRELAPGGDLPKLVEAMVAAHHKRVMVIGHEPDLSGLVSFLLDAPMPMAMQKAMVVGFHLAADGKPKLRFILEPKSLVWELDARKPQ